MAVYDLEEQEQLDDLKAWWNALGQRGHRRSSSPRASRSPACRAGAGGRRSQAEEASALFAGCRRPRAPTTSPKAKDATAQLEDQFARHRLRAARARWCCAKLLFDGGDTAGARAQLQWVVDRADETELKEIARYRLAEVLLDDKQYDEALEGARREARRRRSRACTPTCAATRSPRPAAPADARAAYQSALAKLDAKSPYRNYVQVKLDALGGAPAAPAAAPRPRAPPPAAPAGTAAPAPAAAPAPRRRAAPPRQAMTPRDAPRRTRIAALARVAALRGSRCVALAGCATIYEYLPVPPSFSLRWLWSSKKPGPLPELKATATARVNWQVAVGKAVPGFAPAVAAGRDLRRRRPTARSRASIRRPAARSGASAPAGRCRRASAPTRTSSSSAPTRATSSRSTPNGKPQVDGARCRREVIAPPRVADGVVAVFAGDGSVYALSAADGAKKWVNQRATPPLTVRNYAGGVDRRAAASSSARPAAGCSRSTSRTGIVGWDAHRRQSEGRDRARAHRRRDRACRSIDEQQVCAVAYQGRLACFDIARGTLNWSRDVSSLYGLAADAQEPLRHRRQGRRAGARQPTGASVWKQDLLAERKIGGPQIVGDLRRRRRRRRLPAPAVADQRRLRRPPRHRRHAGDRATRAVPRQRAVAVGRGHALRGHAK